MSVSFESPTRYMSDNNSLYSVSDNESHTSSTNTTPFKPATTPSPLTANGSGNGGSSSYNYNNHQEFLNVIQARQLANSSTGWIIAPSPSSAQQQPPQKSPLQPHHRHPHYHHHHHNKQTEDLAPIKGEILNDLMIKSNDIHNQSTQLIIIDVRSFNYFLKNRIKSAINVSIPSILLKRPAYTMERVYESITYDDEAVDRLKKWTSATNIIFYDHSSYQPSDSGNSASAVLLGSKLRNFGYKGQLNYLQGGFNTFNELYVNQCEMKPLEEKKDKEINKKTKKQKRPTGIALHLPTAAITNDNKKALGMHPFFSNIRQNLELSHGSLKERFEVRLPYGLKNKDGIISSLSTTLSPSASNHPRFGLAGSSVDQDGNFQLPVWMRDIMNTENGPKKLAEMYEKLERTEQKRLSTIMNYHSTHENPMIAKAIEKENPMTIDQNHNNSNYFPFSIVSSMEKGTLNRYDNIWPYDYSRVKLTKKDDDYINANYVQYADIKENITLSPIHQSSQEIQLQKDGQLSQASLCTMNKLNVELDCNRQYISTQGPLPTTFNDFWKMIWDENSYVVVMLTQEMEMNKIKCHRYWPSFLNVPQEYGSFTVTLVSELKQPVLNMNDKKRDREEDHANDDEVIYIRKFNLKYGTQERTITQLQYTGWTDFGVPDQPIGILQLVHQADEAAAAPASAASSSATSEIGPMIVHCSAGCGRSGTFCTIDTIIQRLWHERDVYTSTSVDKVVETVGRFREQRMSMVQTHRQFVFCYEAILWWLLGYGYLPANSSNTAIAPASFSPLPIQIDKSVLIPSSIMNLSSSGTIATGTTTKRQRSDSIASIFDDFKIL